MRLEGYRNLCSVVKKKGSGNKEFHRATWPVVAAAARSTQELVELKAKLGLGKVYRQTETGCRGMQNAIIEALHKNRLEKECAVIVGKGEVERVEKVERKR